MKKVYYNSEMQYLITDREFAEAMIEWAKKLPFWCSRLEVLLSPYFKIVETPRVELGKKIMIDLVGGQPRRLFKNAEGNYVEILDRIGSTMMCRIDKEKMKEFEKRLVSQEDFYNTGRYKLLDNPKK